MSKLVIDDLPDAEDRFELGECLGTGVCGKVFSALDTAAGGQKVAVKVQRINKETLPYIQEEYRVLSDLSQHPNLLDFHGAYRKVGEADDEVWFVLELCDGGPVSDLVSGLTETNRRLTEEQIGYILKEVVKAMVHLHENRVIHRDIKASNVLLTKEGEIKLADFGLCRHISSTFGKSDSCIGSPSWMAPEVVMSSAHDDEESGYGNRADVWALGITAIELADGKTPFEEMHPTRAMFQIVRNPPPTLYRPANWTETFNDFVNECLVKNPEHRPYVMELMEHPFLAELPENYHHLSQEIKMINQDIAKRGKRSQKAESLVNRNFLKRSRETRMEKMNVEDLAALDRINEDAILQELQARMKHGQFQTFIGDILLILNPNENQEIYGETYHKKHVFKSRSDNAPHIYSIADSAYQDALHHDMTQNIVLAGESGSGKTTNFMHLLDHILYLGKNENVNSERIKNAVKLVHAFTHASTPLNDYSTRCVMKAEISFGTTGKVSGAVFNVHQLEKWRVSSMDMFQSNYHILYYLYDGLNATKSLSKHHLTEGRNYRYLRIPDENTSKTRPRDNPKENAKKFAKILEILQSFEFTTDEIDLILNLLSAILIIGEVRFKESEQGVAEIENEDVAFKVAALLEVDEKKLLWALTNYCLIKQGTAVRRRHNCDEARDARDVLANTLYCRVADHVTNVINHKLSVGKIVFGDKYKVRIYDMSGFECFKQNHLPQLFVNSFNEQLQYHFLQRVFAWEALEMNEEEIPFQPLHYYDNKNTLDQILSKPEGVLTLIDDASRMGHGGEYVIDYLKNPERDHVKILNGKDFSVAHFTGKVNYTAKEMPDRNRDFLPPEVIETIRLSRNKTIKTFFTNKLTRTGNLSASFDELETPEPGKGKLKMGASMDEGGGEHQQYSQIKKMRTSVSTFRSLCLDILKELSVGGGAGGTHFVRCVRSDLEGNPRGFHAEIVKQQLRAMAIIDTAKARQRGYPHRIPFSEFLRRYKFLAFDFEENVDISKDNCRLLLVRLKMEGWVIGKSKVFLKYYNEEYLSRLYETQVKKIIKVQAVMRSFLAKIKMRQKSIDQRPKVTIPLTEEEQAEENAARVLQKAYRGVANRKSVGKPVQDKYDRLDPITCKFIKLYCDRWKAKSIFQVLLQYRAARYQDLFYFSQQVHLYNQSAVFHQTQYNNNIGLDLVNKHAQPNAWLGEMRLTVAKLPFRLDEIPFFDTSYMCDPLTNLGVAMEKDENWDSPFQWRETVSSHITTIQNEPENPAHAYNQEFMHRPSVVQLINLPYTRDPNEPIRRLSSIPIEAEPEYPGYRQRNHPPPPPMPYNQSSRNDYNNFQNSNGGNRNYNQNHRNGGYQNNNGQSGYSNNYTPSNFNASNRDGNPSGRDFVNSGSNRDFAHSNNSNRDYGHSNRDFGNSNISNRDFSHSNSSNRDFGNSNNSNRDFGHSNSSNRDFGHSNSSNRDFGHSNSSNRDFASSRNAGNQNKFATSNKDFNNSTPANKDFEYIKHSSSTSRSKNFEANPITELQSRGKCDANGEDDPPFNFQAMLRKTNVNRESVKKSVDAIRNVSLKKRGENLVYDSRNNSRNNSLRKHNSEGYLNKEKLQLAPGIFIEGVVSDL